MLFHHNLTRKNGVDFLRIPGGGYDSVGTIAGYDSGCLFVVPEPDAEHNLEYARPYIFNQYQYMYRNPLNLPF